MYCYFYYHAVFPPDHGIAKSHIAFRDGPQKNGKRANLALSVYKATGLIQAYYFKSPKVSTVTF